MAIAKETIAKDKALNDFREGLTLTLGGRNFDDTPYSKDEQRVVEWMQRIIPDIGGGEDPLGFFLASYEVLIHERKDMKREIAALKLDNDRLYAATRTPVVAAIDETHPPYLREFIKRGKDAQVAVDEYLATIVEKNKE